MSLVRRNKEAVQRNFDKTKNSLSHRAYRRDATFFSNHLQSQLFIRDTYTSGHRCSQYKEADLELLEDEDVYQRDDVISKANETFGNGADKFEEMYRRVARQMNKFIEENPAPVEQKKGA